MKLCGIDEAGRGPVIGPLVMTGVLIDDEDEAKFAEMGVKDSKLVLPNKRKNLFSKIKSISKEITIAVSPQEIDAALMSKDLNLNWLEALKSIEIIKKLRPDRVIIDCPSTSPDKFNAYIKDGLKKTGYSKKTEIITEHKADENYPVVGAASIIAKVTRDESIERLKEKYGDLGSGYPSDKKTQEFLEKNWKKHPEIFRRTWASYKKYVEKKDQSSLSDF